jgi:negative regulator of sigma E activity
MLQTVPVAADDRERVTSVTNKPCKSYDQIEKEHNRKVQALDKKVDAERDNRNRAVLATAARRARKTRATALYNHVQECPGCRPHSGRGIRP